MRYDGKNNNSIPNSFAAPCTKTHRWYRALSSTKVTGTDPPRAAILPSKAHTEVAVMYVVLISVTNSCVTAFNAPSTLYRCRPDAARTWSRTRHQTHPRNDANTKCDASTKYTTRLPPRASANFGSSSAF